MPWTATEPASAAWAEASAATVDAATALGPATLIDTTPAEWTAVAPDATAWAPAED